MKQPIAKKTAKKLTIHKHTRIDNYYWLNNKDNSEVIDYLNEENKYCEAKLKHTENLQNELYEETNVCRSVSIALNAVSAERVLILMGDLVFNKEALSTLDFQRSCISANLDEHRGGEVGCVVSPDNTISNMMYDLDLKWNQIIYLQSKELDIFKSICTKRKYRKRS